MDALFDTCLAFTLAQEGGFVNNPRDPGGATYKGITLASLRTWLRAPNTTIAVLRGLDQTTITKFYRSQFWDICQCGVLPAGVDLMVFDHAVNAGDGRSAHRLQDVLGVLSDGEIGPKTLTAVAAWDPGRLIHDLRDAQEAYYRACEKFPIFGDGWLNRLSRRFTAANRLTGPSPATPHAIAA